MVLLKKVLRKADIAVTKFSKKKVKAKKILRKPDVKFVVQTQQEQAPFINRFFQEEVEEDKSNLFFK